MPGLKTAGEPKVTGEPKTGRGGVGVAVGVREKVSGAVEIILGAAGGGER